MSRTMIWVLIIGAVLIGLAVTGLVIGFLVASRGAVQRPAPGQYGSDGQTIYMTGYTTQGQRISFSDGPQWLRVHGGGCADCHGADGRGGQPVMMGTEVPPDIRYAALLAYNPPYTDDLIKRAITKGLDSEGEKLDPTMPRWQMTDQELNDVLAYLKTLK